MGKDIPEEVRRKILSAQFSWLTNAGPEIYEDATYLSKHTLGRPMPTERHSEEELINMGMAGVYRRNDPS